MRIQKFNNCMILGLVAVLALSWTGNASAQKINCANEFRSGKLYFSQNIFKKSVERFAVAVEICPDKSEYRTRYAMALAQYGDERIDYLGSIPDSAGKKALSDSVVAMYTLAGKEFEAGWNAPGAGKKQQKLVRENREHYWVDRYNDGIKLYEEENYTLAELHFRLARVLDSKKIKAYSQGAIALIQLSRQTEAADLVQEGLAVDAEDENLNKLLDKIYLEAADELTMASEKEKDVEKAEKALWYLNELMTRGEEGASNENLIFKAGLAHMAKGTAQQAAATQDGDTAPAAESFVAAADKFSKAGELVSFDTEDPENQNNDFHLACLFNKVQCLMNAEDCEGGVVAIKEYLEKNFKEPYMWKLWTFCLQMGEQADKAVAAIMVSNSLSVPPASPDGKGLEIAVADAMTNAKEDAKTALDTLGPPDAVYGYQTDEEYQINTWFWLKHRKAMSFVLGVKNGEIDW